MPSRQIPSQSELSTSVGLARAIRELHLMNDEVMTLARSNVQRDSSDSVGSGAEVNSPQRTPEQIAQSSAELGLTEVGKARHNFEARANPDPVSNNLSQGYSKGSFWGKSSG